jgi:hypothetical protein
MELNDIQLNVYQAVVDECDPITYPLCSDKYIVRLMDYQFSRDEVLLALFYLKEKGLLIESESRSGDARNFGFKYYKPADMSEIVNKRLCI